MSDDLTRMLSALLRISSDLPERMADELDWKAAQALKPAETREYRLAEAVRKSAARIRAAQENAAKEVKP